MAKLDRISVVLLSSILLLAGSVASSGSEPLTDESAQRITEEIADSVAAIRGLPFKESVAVEVVDPDAAAEHALNRLKAFDLLDRLEAQQTAYRILGLIDEEVELLELFSTTIREQAGGFYDPGKKKFYLVQGSSGTLVSILAAHELTHALEDQHFDLDARIGDSLGNDDRSFAVGAIHEGSATLVMTVFAGRSMMSGDLDMTELQEMAQEESERAAALRATPAILTRGLLGAYMLGANFLARGNVVAVAANGIPLEDLKKVFAAGPVSSEQILHPAKYWDPAQRDLPLPVSLGKVGKRLGEGWHKVEDGEFGELNLGTLIGLELPSAQALATFDPTPWTAPAVVGWGGDRWELWSHGDGRSVVLLSTRWDSEKDAVEFQEALANRSFHVARRGDRVVIVAGEQSEARVERLLGTLLSAHQD